MNGAFGHYLYNNTANTVIPIGNLGTRNIAKSLLGTGTQESISNPIAPSTRFLEKGNYMKLANATLSYRVGNLGNAFKNLNVSLTGQNLFVITNYTGFDPEVNVNNPVGGIPSLGLDIRPYPSARTILLGVNFHSNFLKHCYMKHFKIVIVVLAGFTIFSCTKLDENFRGELEQSATGNIDPALLLTGVYQSINGVFQEGNVWHLGQHSSDETIGPTRGPDWDDNGEWRALHLHTWNGDNSHIRDGFRDLLSAQFAASNMLQFNPNAQQAAEARFIRALTMFCVLDGWNQVPYREDLTDYTKTPVTLKGAEAADFIIGELNAIVNDLPDGSGPAYVASKNAARALLMKTYLNKGAFANRESPTFDNGDMAQVVTLADQIISSGKYSLSDNIFDNFAPTNDAISTENIFTLRNEPGVTGGNVRGMWFQVLHYNQNPGDGMVSQPYLISTTNLKQMIAEGNKAILA